ncbi:MAG: GGDEF domain-containing protein [Ruminiclostridium sp.]
MLNRNCYENNIGSYSEKCASSLSCIFVDVNGLHELNNTKGHDAGDEMLKAVANELHDNFEDSDLYRIGGDEFVAFVRDGDEKQSEDKLSGISARLTEQGYHISIGIYSQSVPVDIDSMIKEAERRMYEKKREYYDSMDVDRCARR